MLNGLNEVDTCTFNFYSPLDKMVSFQLSISALRQQLQKFDLVLYVNEKSIDHDVSRRIQLSADSIMKMCVVLGVEIIRS
jgi:hypothetical protein